MKTAQKAAPAAPPKKKSPLPALVSLFFLTGLAAGGLWYYKTYGSKLPKLIMPGQEAEKAGPAAPKSAMDFGASGAAEGATPATTPTPEPAKAPEKPSALSQIPNPGTAPAPDKAPAPVPAPPKPPFTANPANQLVGNISRIEEVQRGNDMFRYILLKHGADSRWAMYAVSLKKPGFEMGELNALIGKHVRMTGAFVEETGSRGTVLHLNDRKQIEVQQ